MDLIAHTSLSVSPIRHGFAPGFLNYKKGCNRLVATSDKVYQLLVQGLWFSPDTPASSTTKTGRHDIAEIMQKVALNTTNQINLVICIKQCSRYMKIEGHRRRSPAECGSNKFLLVFITVGVAFKDTLYTFYPAISTFAVQIYYTNKFLLYS